MIGYHVISKNGNREVNEDSVGTAVFDKASVFVVADGLGGHGCGDIASRYVVETFLTSCSESSAYNAENYISSAFLSAQLSILKRQKESRRLSEMKSTAAAVICTTVSITVGHIGDTRVYLFNNKGVMWRTTDHSVVQMLALAGEIKEKEIRRRPDRNKLLRALGNQCDELKFDISKFDRTDDIRAVLLCSDGFWEYIDERHMSKALKLSSKPQEWLERMENIVLKNGKNKNMDNYSAIAVML